MTDRPRALRLALVAGALILPVLAGCNGQAAPLSKDEQAQFKGGPMPEAARQGMMERMKQARQGAPNGAPPEAGPH